MECGLDLTGLAVVSIWVTVFSRFRWGDCVFPVLAGRLVVQLLDGGLLRWSVALKGQDNARWRQGRKRNAVWFRFGILSLGWG
eukprot:978272-Rhodomonas_salina.1